jgi:hypothetical protein
MSEASPETQAQETEAPETEAVETDLTAEVEKWKTLARKNEARAKENSAAAKRLAEIEEAGKSEAQKAQDRIAALERELESTRTTALRSRIQAKHGISDEDAELFLTGSDEDTLTKQAERLAERVADRKKGGLGPYVPAEGKSPADRTTTDVRPGVDRLRSAYATSDTK